MAGSRFVQIVGFSVALLAVPVGAHADDKAASATGGATTAPAAASPIQFRIEPIIDRQQGGLVLATLTVPQDWKVVSKVEWKYQDVSHPVRAMARAEAPDGSAWVEYFPAEVFYWLDPVRAPVAVGSRGLGMIYVPNITLPDAMQHFVIAPYRGKEKNLKIVGSRPVTGLMEAFGLPPAPGEAMSVRLRYSIGDKIADEDLYAMLGSGNRIPYTGPQGTWYESHRPLLLAHAVGATDGQLEHLYPLLAFIARSLRIDPAWDAHRQQVLQQLSAEFNRQIARGYAQIQAAVQASRAISANNDAMLASIEIQRRAQNQRDAAARQAAASAHSPTDDFDQYIRGTERMKDPYWGESEQSYQQQYHWTDGYGNYRSSNDPSYNPNVGAGGGPTWQQMEPAGR